jgi:hypothetical protein
MPITLTECKTDGEAWMSIFSGVFYFFKKKPIRTVLTIAVLMTFPVYLAVDYFSTYRATIEEALPIGMATVSSFELVNDGQDRAEKIIIKGQVYGYAQPGFKAWVLKDEPSILVYDIAGGEIFKVAIRGLEQRK